MAQQNINLGTPPAGVDGDTVRGAMAKVQTNFTELYAAGASSPTSGFKNKLINGRFDFWQRGINFAATGYTADRWSANMTLMTSASVGQGVFPAGDGISVLSGEKYFAVLGSTGNTDATNHIFNLVQRIEGVQTFAGKNVVVSGRIWNGNATNRSIAIGFNQNFGVGGSATVTAIGAQVVVLAPGWNNVVLKIAVPSIAGKTIGTSQDNLTFILWLSAGTALAAQAANLGAQSGTLYFSNLQVEEGDTVTPFEMRPYGVELALCQRYYEKSYNLATAPGSTGAGGSSISFSGGLAGNTYSTGQQVTYKVSKRATPAVTMYSVTTGASGKVRDQYSAADVNASLSASSEGGFFWSAQNAASQGGWNMQGQWTADAEL